MGFSLVLFRMDSGRYNFKSIMKLIFVYGTLKRGYGNNKLLYNHTFISDGIVHGYKLYNCGFPIARQCNSASSKGELWDIEDNKETLYYLDRLESEGHMYFRRQVEVHTPQGNFEADMYVGGEGYWRFDDLMTYNGLKECPLNAEGHYEWNR